MVAGDDGEQFPRPPYNRGFRVIPELKTDEARERLPGGRGN
jgi:hypothetical protein